MSNASNLSNLANVLDDGSDGQFLKSTGSGGVAFAMYANNWGTVDEIIDDFENQIKA